MSEMKSVEAPLVPEDLECDLPVVDVDEKNTNSNEEKGDTETTDDVEIVADMCELKTPVGLAKTRGTCQSIRNEELLVRRYSKEIYKAEEAALNFVTDSLHHPAISCFREINRADFNLMFTNSKLKKSTDNFGLVITCIGLIDYFAVSYNNPLYCDHYSPHFLKSARVSVPKIIHDLKPVLSFWARCDNEILKTRYKAVMKYLKGLAPFFDSPGFDIPYMSLLSSIESDSIRKPKGLSKSATTNPLGSSTTPNIVTPKSLSDDQSPALKKVKQSSNENSKKSVSSKPIFPVQKKSIEVEPVQGNKRSLVSPEKPTVEVKKIKVSDDNDVVCLSPEVKVKTISSSSNSSSTSTKIINNDGSTDKPKVNAFALLMNRSKQLAREDKLRKLGNNNTNAPSPATKSHKPMIQAKVSA